ncbi:MAG: hypothetical protein ABJO57_11650 [Lentilitoribacter sp.]
MEIQEIGYIHYAAALTIAAIFGFVAHVVRGFVNPYPDKLSDSAVLNIAVSDDYSLSDLWFGVEFDAYGYYELYSMKNLKLSVYGCVFGCFVLMAFDAATGSVIASLLDTMFENISEYLAHRFDIIEARYFS